MLSPVDADVVAEIDAIQEQTNGRIDRGDGAVDAQATNRALFDEKGSGVLGDGIMLPLSVDKGFLKYFQRWQVTTLVNLGTVFGIAVPYLAILLFVGGFCYRIYKWASSPVPFRIPTVCGSTAP